ncbi:butyrate kinase [candidate division KSB1 bacterium]|nr:MAG: butyrate kinase [candidate division KSB1 bacterium]
MEKILAINPGSTSTKIALYDGEEEVWTEKISYKKDKINEFDSIIDQLDMRKSDIDALLKEKNVLPQDLDAVVGRGGPFKPLESGTYIVNDSLINDIKGGNVQAEHISNIGALLANDIAQKAGISSYFVDPVSVDEFEPVARISGIPEIERKSLVHALNVKATAYKEAKRVSKPLDELNLIVAHLGGGISICPVKSGKIVDTNNANEGGPFSPERAGSLPSSSLAKLCFSGKFSYKEIKKRIVGNGGLSAYLGTNNMQEVVKRVKSGDNKAALIFDAMVYQIAKEIGAMATVLFGKIDSILLTGGMAAEEFLVNAIKERISFLAPVVVYPGENEMESLVMGVLRVLRKEENVKEY